jgi:hypothetical protein
MIIIVIIAAAIIAIGFTALYRVGAFGRDKIRQARDVISKISGTPADELVLSDEPENDLGITVFSDDTANYKYMLDEGRLASMLRRDMSDITQSGPEGSLEAETKAKEIASANYNRYSSEIKNPVIAVVSYNRSMKIYFVRINDMPEPGVSSGNSSVFWVSSSGILAGVSNHYEDRSITEHINYAKIVSKEEAIRLAKDKDTAGDLKEDNIETLLTASMGKLVWLVFPKDGYGGIHTYEIDAYYGTVHFATPK